MKQTREIGEIASDLQCALKAYGELDKVYSDARNRRTDALNRVNALQKEFDERVDGLRWSAPQGSAWQQPKGERAA